MFGMGTGGTSPSLPPVGGLRPISTFCTSQWLVGMCQRDSTLAGYTLTTAQIGFNTSDLTIDLIVSLNVVSFDSSFGFVLSSA